MGRNDLPRTVAHFMKILAADYVRYLQSVWLRSVFRTQGVFIASHVDIRVDARGTLDIAKGVLIGKNTIIVVTSEGQHAVRSLLRIGEGTAINESNNIRASGGTISIGRKCLIAQFVSIIASNHDIDVAGDMMDSPWSLKDNFVTIGDNVWVGAGSVILPGVTIGHGAVIAAGSVVTTDVGENELHAGVPARLLRKRNV